MLNPQILQRQVTMFRSVTTTTEPFLVTVEKVIGRIQSPQPSTLGLISKIREGTSNKQLKQELPVILWSGIFSARNDSSLEEHSGLFVIDIDGLDNPEELKSTLAHDDYTLICFTSPSGNGLKIVVQISNPERHRDHYRAFVKYYDNQYGLTVDSTSINESRACYESYDPDIIYKPSAKVFGAMLSEQAERQEVKVSDAPFTDYEQLNISARMIRKADDGEKHQTLLRASRLCGGFISAGRMEESEVRRVLLREIEKRDIDSVDNAKKTIEDGIEQGKLMPIKEMMEEKNKAEREMKINDGDMSFISSDDEDFRWINDFAEGRIKMGLDTGVNILDEHFRFKKNFTVINGHSNIGKTTFATYLQTASSMRHGWKWLMYTSENKTASQKMKIMAFAMGKPVNEMSYSERVEAFNWVNKHYTFIDNKSVYSFSDILLFAEKVKRNQDLDGIFIDPYNALRRDIGFGSKLGVHEYDYEAMSEMLTFSNANNVAVWLNAHAVTEAQRMKGDDGLPIAPFAEQTEGGGKFVNRADDFLTFHRKIQHPERDMRRTVELHVRKVRETETGGSPTPLDSPVLFEMSSNGATFYHKTSTSKMFTPLCERQIQTTIIQPSSVDEAF
jgi:hypothetical protein